MQHFDDKKIIEAGLRVLDIEANSIRSLANRLDNNFVAACRAILSCKGRVIVIGIGKSGHIARKIAATLASTGTPSFFVHPAEAAHGDLGMITQQDLLIAISKSGETEEILRFMPILKRRDMFLIAITGKPNSTLAKLANVHLDVSIEREACALNLAPTASSTVTLALGDALAVTLLQARGFTEEDFARSHPGGILGRRLLVKVSDIMFTDDKLPITYTKTKISNAILEISKKCLGMTAVVDKNAPTKVVGVCTDGDLRRAFGRGIDLEQNVVDEIMNTNFKTIYSDLLANEALHLMQEHKISALPVVDRDNNLVGALNLHNLFSAGVL